MAHFFGRMTRWKNATLERAVSGMREERDDLDVAFQHLKAAAGFWRWRLPMAWLPAATPKTLHVAHPQRLRLVEHSVGAYYSLPYYASKLSLGRRLSSPLTFLRLRLAFARQRRDTLPRRPFVLPSATTADAVALSVYIRCSCSLSITRGIGSGNVT